MSVLDPRSDSNGVELHRLQQLYTFPDFVKKASLEDTIKPAADLEHTVYADQVNRRYPCHTAAATWLSALYLHEKQAELKPDYVKNIGRQINRFIDFWQIKPACDAFVKEAEDMQKQAEEKLSNDDFALVWQDEKGNTQRRCRMINTREVKAAADWLVTYRDAFPFTDRYTIANKIMEKAAQYGCDLGDNEIEVAKHAGQGFCNPHEVVEMLCNRAKLANNPEHQAGIMKLASTIAAAPNTALTPDQLVKLAEVVESIDRSLGLVGKYTELLPRPEDVIFKTTFKEAKAAVDCAVTLTTGNTYDRSEFEKISLDSVRDLLGSDFASEIADGLSVNTTKLAELAETLPRGDAELFERLLTEAGIPPIRDKTAADSADRWEALAASY